MSIKIEKTEIFGWEAAIRGARNPKNSWAESDSLFYDCSSGDTFRQYRDKDILRQMDCQQVYGEVFRKRCNFRRDDFRFRLQI